MELKKSIISCVLLALLVTTMQAQEEKLSPDPYANETKEENDARMEWFREAKFGMFIHWGVYAVPAGKYKGEEIGGIGEWIMKRASIPVDEYQAYAKDFNPIHYDADAWVKLAKDAGMKYIVITSKHHDGFALYDSKVSKWDVVDATPYGKDLIAPLAEACKKHGLKLGLYYSQAQDWNQGGATSGGKGQWDPKQTQDMDGYIRNIAVPQVAEILIKYQPAILWWDTPRDMNKERADQLLPLLKLSPGIISNNRLGAKYKGDIKTPEQHIPGTGIPGDWESCMTMNSTWGYKSYDDNWKSTQKLVHNLVDIASKGGNYLLNIGPKKDGLIPQPSIERLKEIGVWMKTNSTSIYGTKASPCRAPDWGRITTKVDGDVTTLYLNVFKWPKDGKLFLPVVNKVISCELLVDSSRTFKTKTDEKGTTVSVTGKAPDKISSVIVLKIKGKPETSTADRIHQAKDGSISLPGKKAIINNTLGTYVEYNEKNQIIEEWSKEKATVDFDFIVKKPGKFKVMMTMASEEESTLSISSSGKSILKALPATGGLKTFKEVNVGTIEIEEAGDTAIHFAPKKKAWKQINLKSVKLIPVK